METLNLLQWVPSETGTDQIPKNKGTWHGHNRISATRAVCSEVEISRPVIQHRRKMALK